MKRDPYAEGRAAYTAGMTTRNNPYRYGAPRHEWSRGHSEAWRDSPAGQAERERRNKAAQCFDR